MFADLWKDFLSRFWWSILAVLILIGGTIWWYVNSQTVMVSGYRVSQADAKAVQYYLAGEIDKAQSAYEEITKQHPGDWFAWDCLGNIYRDKNQYGSAETAYLKALAAKPKFEQAYRDIYSLYYSWSVRDKDPAQLGKSEPILLRGLRSLPESVTILEDLISYYAKTGDQQKLQQYRGILDTMRNPQPKTKLNSILAPFTSK